MHSTFQKKMLRNIYFKIFCMPQGYVGRVTECLFNVLLVSVLLRVIQREGHLHRMDILGCVANKEVVLFSF